jgi:hypothetical protein
VNDGYVTRGVSISANSKVGCSCDETDRAAGYRDDVQVGDRSSNENLGSTGAVVVKGTVGLRSDDLCLIWGIV